MPPTPSVRFGFSMRLRLGLRAEAEAQRQHAHHELEEFHGILPWLLQEALVSGSVIGRGQPQAFAGVIPAHQVRVSAATGRQTSSRFSIMVTRASITMTKAASTNMPANTPATSNVPSACWMM